MTLLKHFTLHCFSLYTVHFIEIKWKQIQIYISYRLWYKLCENIFHVFFERTIFYVKMCKKKLQKKYYSIPMFCWWFSVFTKKGFFSPFINLKSLSIKVLGIYFPCFISSDEESLRLKLGIDLIPLGTKNKSSDESWKHAQFS